MKRWLLIAPLALLAVTAASPAARAQMTGMGSGFTGGVNPGAVNNGSGNSNGFGIPTNPAGGFSTGAGPFSGGFVPNSFNAFDTGLGTGFGTGFDNGFGSGFNNGLGFTPFGGGLGTVGVAGFNPFFPGAVSTGPGFVEEPLIPAAGVATNAKLGLPVAGINTRAAIAYHPTVARRIGRPRSSRAPSVTITEVNHPAVPSRRTPDEERVARRMVAYMRDTPLVPGHVASVTEHAVQIKLRQNGRVVTRRYRPSEVFFSRGGRFFDATGHADRLHAGDAVMVPDAAGSRV